MAHSMSAVLPEDRAGFGAAGSAGARCDGVTGGLLFGAAAAAGAAALAGAAGAAPSPSASSTTTIAPSDSVSPSFTLISLTTPAAEDGTSSVALSDSRVSRPWSFFTVSPTATSISITGTSL